MLSLHPHRLVGLLGWNRSLHDVLRSRRASSTTASARKRATKTHLKIDYRPKNTSSERRGPRVTAVKIRLRLLQFCRDAQKRRPYLFQFCTSLAIWFGADMIAQQISATEYDVAQTGRMLIIGGSASIPMYKW
jgi:hypothetical protein